MSKRQPLTVANIEAGYDDERYLGWGYLHGRQDLTAAERARADALVLDYANTHGWNYERLFAWCNSRPGRHFADSPFTAGAASCLSVRLEA